jgi:hypothetical protein
MEQRIGIIKNV